MKTNDGPIGGLYDVRGPLTDFHFAGASYHTSSVTKHADRSGSTVQTQESTSTLGPTDVPKLGSGWSDAYEGKMGAALGQASLLPRVMQESGSLILPYPEGNAGYPRRFATNWNPLRAQVSKQVSIGAAPEGRSLNETSEDVQALAPTPLADGINPYLSNLQNQYRGRGYILVDQWGPYDFRSPILWPRFGTGRKGEGETGGQGEAELFEVLGPKGRWTASKVEGGELSSSSGSVPGYVEFKRAKTGGGRVRIELVYTGGKTVDYRGIVTGAGKQIPFHYTEFSLPIQWHVSFFKYDKNTQEPRTMAKPFRALIAGKRAAELNVNNLDLVPGRIPDVVGNDYFATVADGEFEIEPGDYLLDTTTDDGARVYLDGKLLVDAWKYQGPTLYTRAVHLGGKHKLHVEHFQIDGYWTLKVAIRAK